MATQAPAKPTWQQKVDTFAAMHGPFTRKWDDYRSFRVAEGFLEVTWAGMQSKVPPLIEIEDKPHCACCGSARPMFLYYLTDRNGYKHLVGEECLLALRRLNQVTNIDSASQNWRQHDSEDKAG